MKQALFLQDQLMRLMQCDLKAFPFDYKIPLFDVTRIEQKSVFRGIETQRVII